jgi:glyoxylase-like metal-dependent hydrolase (beta-lactamase superfamily II)
MLMEAPAAAFSGGKELEENVVFGRPDMGAEASALAWTTSPSSEAGFLRAPALVTGRSETVLIDAGFTYSDGRHVVDKIKISGKMLQDDLYQRQRDYYFNLSVIQRAFPDAAIIAAPETVRLMRARSPLGRKSLAQMVPPRSPISCSRSRRRPAV